MRRLREAVRRKDRCCERPLAGCVCVIHHDGTPAHTANLMQQFLTKYGTIQLARSPYSPDMLPPDFFSFPRSRTP
ncbi:hypothetical protein TNCV_1030831 [Trichonephila clavipes]|nr:hypothetical protein TNCV_1030831 [Trichonephila clavipes]